MDHSRDDELADQAVNDALVPPRRREIKRAVVRVDKSPLNPKRKCVELSCGHEVWLNKAPRKGTLIYCEHCSKTGY